MAREGAGLLQERLAEDLPEGCRFIIHHLSSPPSRVPAIFARLPGQYEDVTYCEIQFLSVSIEHRNRPVQVFAIEVLIYTTEHLTTLFVSKADSTGYLYLLKLSEGTPSPLRIVCTTFLRFLIENRVRLDRKLVLSLFARAQNQYLFPGSIENSHKHVLDDRGLIKWWCKVVDPLLEEQNAPLLENTKKAHGFGFLRVPGCDKYESRGFLPQSEHRRHAHELRWIIGDPLRDLGQSSALPERCLIPRFPDDPKARFLLELDDELPEFETDKEPPVGADGEPLPPHEGAGHWMSVKSLDHFWEMMSFRQECAAGRLVGFMWAVFTPDKLRSAPATSETVEREAIPTSLPTPQDSQSRETDESYVISMPLLSALPPASSSSQSPQKLSQAPPTPSPAEVQEKRKLIDQPEQTKDYFWPPSSRGDAILTPKDYKRVGGLLLSGDYANEEIAMDSTEKLINDIVERTGSSGGQGRVVVGKNKMRAAAPTPFVNGPMPTMLTSGLVKKKKKRPAEDVADDVKPNESGAHIIPEDAIRKKAKTADSTESVKPTT